MRDSLAGDTMLTFNPGVILGGTTIAYDTALSGGRAEGKANVVAESTLVSGDLRCLSVAEREAAKATMRTIVAQTPPHAWAAVDFVDGSPPMAPTPGNLELLRRFDRASRDLGFGPVEATDPRRAGAADVSFTQGLTPMAIDGVGLMGTGGHTAAETGDLRTLPMNAERVAVTLLRLAAERRRSR
jgi:glutamate carboxypeptidase